LSKLLRAHSLGEMPEDGARHGEHLQWRVASHELHIVQELDQPHPVRVRHNICAAEACQG
jgi:hypothetical protein